MGTEGIHLYGDRAPHSEQFVVLSLSDNLTSERVLTGTANQIVITDNGAGSTVVLSLASSLVVPGTMTFTNAGLHILDTGGDHDLIISPGSDLSTDRVLTLTTGDAARTITLSGNPTLADWFDQAVKQASTPTFGGLTINGNIGVTGTVDAVDVAGANAASFLTLGVNAYMANERVLTGTANQITITDNGAGSTVVLSIPSDLIITGTIDIVHTATSADDHAFETDVDAAGYGDVKAIDIDYITGAIAAGQDEGIILVNIDETLATGGDIFALEVLATDGDAGIYGLKAGVLVGPVHQDSGTFANPTTATDNTIGSSVTAATIGFTQSPDTITDSNSGFGNFVVGEIVVVTGATTGANNTTYTITAAAAGALTVTPQPNTVEDDGATITVDGTVPAMADGSTGTTTDIFEADNEYIIIGAAAAFQEIELIFTIVSSKNIKPTFWYSTAGTGQFSQFTPVDGTDGCLHTGVIAWDASDLSVAHVADNGTGTFDIKIIRTKNTIATSPTLGYAKTASTTEYVWDKDGDVNIKDLSASGTVAATTVTGANVTSGGDPGHTHTGSSVGSIDISDDTNLAVTSPIVLTDDTLSIPAATNAAAGHATAAQITALEANTVHLSSIGTDHGYIDQDLQIAASPSFAGGTYTGHLLFTADNSYNIGEEADNRPANVFAATSLKAPNFGAPGNLTINPVSNVFFNPGGANFIVKTVYGSTAEAGTFTIHSTSHGTKGPIILNPTSGNVSVGTTGSSGKVHIDQLSTTAAIPVLVLDQADISEEFVKFIGSAASGVLTQSIVDEGDQASESLEGWLKIEVEDIGNQIADQAYFIPIYTLSA